MRQVIHGEIYSKDFSSLERLIRDYSSCKRYSFVRFQKGKLKLNEVRDLAKKKYNSLNTRQISDAVKEAEGLYTLAGKEKVIFGGRKLWEKLKSNLITNEDWKEARDNKIYARGDKAKKGNPNIRIVTEDKIRVTIGERKFEQYSLFIPKKYRDRLTYLLNLGIAYNVRLKRKDKERLTILKMTKGILK